MSKIAIYALAAVLILGLALTIIMKLVGLGESKAYLAVEKANADIRRRQDAVRRTTGRATSDSLRDGRF